MYIYIQYENEDYQILFLHQKSSYKWVDCKSVEEIPITAFKEYSN